jgi:hypothetical protein
LICCATALSLAAVPAAWVEDVVPEVVVVDEELELLLPHAAPTTAKTTPNDKIAIRCIDTPKRLR